MLLSCTQEVRLWVRGRPNQACNSCVVVSPDQVAIPTWQGFLKPVLDAWKTRDQYKAVCDHVGLTEAQRAETLQSGQSRAENRIGWAVSALYKAELIEKPDRGAYVLTVAGQQFRLENPAAVAEKTLKTLPAYQAYQASIANVQNPTKPSIPEESAADPLESIENSIATLHSEVAAELLKRLRDLGPELS